MKNVIYIYILPALMYAQSHSEINSKRLIFSFQCGAKIYSGSQLLEHRDFTREGVFTEFSFFTKKRVAKKTNIISKATFCLSNAVAKSIDVGVPETDIIFTTKIPNILACNLNYSISINKKINNTWGHEMSLKIRVLPLFYKKGKIFNDQQHSLGGLISSEINGSLPDLEKPAQILYGLNYSFSKLKSISILFFINSDWSINNLFIKPLYPGFSIKFKKIITQDFQAPWDKKTNR